MVPFERPQDAAYWGGGIVAPYQGGWVSIHVETTPNGVALWTTGLESPGAPPHRRKAVEGLPPGYVLATPEDGGRKTILALGQEEAE